MRTGNIPQKWYDLYDHQGYSVDGKQVQKMVEPDELEKFIERQEDKEWWRKITDTLNNTQVRLSRADLELIQRVRQRKFADANIDPFEDWNHEIETKEDFIHPFNTGFSHREPKRRFVQSKWERLTISKYIRAMKKGWMKTRA